jgi:hypothetical protein
MSNAVSMIRLIARFLFSFFLVYVKEASSSDYSYIMSSLAEGFRVFVFFSIPELEDP